MSTGTRGGIAARCAKRVGVAVCALATGSMVAAPVSAQVGTELNEFFNDMGAAANATGPTAYQGQSAGYYSGGNIWTRFPQRSVNPVNLQLPSIKAGCGGIDVFSGSFSFINTDEIVAMLKATANNALGFAFQLAIKSISPQIASTIEEMAQKAQQMNQFNMNSCETAQNLVGGLWGKSDRMSSEICKSIGNSQGLFSDWAKGRHECGTGGQRESTIAANSDPNIPAESYNFTWEMLKQSYPSFSVEFREYLMTFVGTVIYYQDGDASGKRGYQFVGQGDQPGFGGRPVGAGLGIPPGGHEHGPYAPLGSRPDDLLVGRHRGAHHQQVRCALGDLLDRRQHRTIQDGPGFPGHGEHLAPVAARQQVVEGHEAEFARVAGHAGHHHPAGLEQRCQVPAAEVRTHQVRSTRASTATGRPSTTISGLRSIEAMVSSVARSPRAHNVSTSTSRSTAGWPRNGPSRA